MHAHGNRALTSNHGWHGLCRGSGKARAHGHHVGKVLHSLTYGYTNKILTALVKLGWRYSFCAGQLS